MSNFGPLSLFQIRPVLTWQVLVVLLLKSASGLTIDSDSSEYNEMYEKLAVEYIQEIQKTTTKAAVNMAAAGWKPPDDLENHYNDDFPGKLNTDSSLDQETAKEIYERKSKRLKCDNPWFWNSLQCAWLDYWNNNEDSKRFKRSTKTAGIFWGIILTIILLPLCFLLITARYFRARVKKFERLGDYYAEKFKPGVMILPDGTKHVYDATDEEQEALEDLLEILTTIV